MEGFRELIELHLAEQEERAARKTQEKLRAQIAELDEELAGAREKKAQAEARRDLVVGERRRLEQEVEELDAKRMKYRQQLMEAKTNEVYRTLLSEIETAAKTISDKETSILELMERVETAETVAAEASRELEEAEGEKLGQAKLLQGEVATLDDVRAAARVKAEAIRKEVPSTLLPTYERIYAGRDSKALAACRDLTCTECQMAVRPQVWVEMLKQETVHNCGGCGRILYREESLQAVPAGSEDDPAPADGS